MLIKAIQVFDILTRGIKYDTIELVRIDTKINMFDRGNLYVRKKERIHSY